MTLFTGRPRVIHLILGLVPVALLFGCAPAAQALPAGFRESVAVSGLERPTALAFAPDGRVFITEQCGKLRLVQRGQLQTNAFASFSTDCEGERGLLGVAVDPNFSRNGYVYIYYTVPRQRPYNRVARITLDPVRPTRMKPGSLRVLMNLDLLSSATNHNGGAIHFGPDGKLYIAVGDTAVSDYSQSLRNRFGKILRINRDGSIPSDNPLLHRTTGDNRAIWAYGLRNPYTFAFDPVDGRMRINDVGRQSWEEVNRGLRGANYGWPDCEGGCDRTGYVDPLYTYSSIGGSAITGGTFNRGRNFPRKFDGAYFFGDYLRGFIRWMKPSGSVASFHSNASSPVDMAFGPNGKLYYLSIMTGRLYRIGYGS